MSIKLQIKWMKNGKYLVKVHKNRKEMKGGAGCCFYESESSLQFLHEKIFGFNSYKLFL